jgi:hypothetical protein
VRLSLCLPYYRNPGMLAEQYRTWADYPPEVREALEVVLVDDGSPEPAADVPRPDGLPPLRIYRVLEDIPWHQHGARNLAASEALGPWLLMTDMDHLVPGESLSALLTVLETASPKTVYTFRRLDAPDLTPTVNERGEAKPHVNTFAIAKATFWAVGGYDEDCVGYGTDSYFRKRLYAKCPAVHLKGIPIIRVPREVIPDASTRPTTPMDPRAFRDAGRRRGETQKNLMQKRGGPPKVLAFDWELVL